jgi:cytidylate kinase
MSIVTISRGSYGRGKAVAERVAACLGYEVIGRDVVLEASQQFNIPEIRLVRNIRNAPSILERTPYGKEQYVSFIQSALLRHFIRDNVIYHGIAGQHFLKGVSHVLKVRILADIEERARAEMEREKITRDEAVAILQRDDEERRKWGRYLYGIDVHDSNLYDLVIQIRGITIDDAADIICSTVKLMQFQTTPESQKDVEDLLLASQIKVELISRVPDIEVFADRGMIVLSSRSGIFRKEDTVKELERLTKAIPGVSEVKFQALPPIKPCEPC